MHTNSMNVVQKFFFFFRKYGLLFALLKTWYFCLRSLYMFFGKFMPAHLMQKLFTTSVVHFASSVSKFSVASSASYFDSASLHTRHHISDYDYTCIYGHDVNFTNAQCVIVAHWDPHGIVDPYVVHQCREFKKMGKKIILASAHPINSCECLKDCSSWCDAIIFRQCQGYDFTSWKAALHCFPSVLNSKELLLTNDSYFGPIYSFDKIHARMATVPCDFWGLNYSLEIAPHLQSFYLVFKPQVLQHECFTKFFDHVGMDNGKDVAVAYEVSLALWLESYGFTGAAYCTLRSWCRLQHNLTVVTPKILISYGVPYLKRSSLFIDGGYAEYLSIRRNYQSAYPWQLLDNYLIRTNADNLSSYIK